MKIRPVILCGGTGTRLWPISRKDLPKQFVEFPKINTNDRTSLFSYALHHFDELKEIAEVLDPNIMASKDYELYARNELNKTDWRKAEIFLEPSAKNTAISLTFAALRNQTENPVLVVIPSDQFVENEAFKKAITCALSSINDINIILLGIKPTSAATGYGYIKTCETPNTNKAVAVEKFVEKPSLEKAKTFIKKGCYLWNSGMLILKARTWLKSIKKCRPDIYESCLSTWETVKLTKDNFYKFSTEKFDRIPPESIDYAVLEKCNLENIPLFLVSFDGKWADLGSWKSVFNTVPKNSEGNFLLGNVFSNNIEQSILISTSRPLVCNSIKNLAVIETSDAVLVSDLEWDQNVKNLVAILEEKKIPQAIEHSLEKKSWGSKYKIEENTEYSINKIIIKQNLNYDLKLSKNEYKNLVCLSGEGKIRENSSTKSIKQGDELCLCNCKDISIENDSNVNLVILEITFMEE